ncbi:hypothetical protein RHMOL_Rhmol01G0082000 [Rhododendron molle]|uniref:Uncharacterized protein n=3 Tax=Rhododendron molle TaxID=49168 RepID=A0ACC0Q0P1_RHOML|nr:hypothetical protein RHMOL_Rhmol01G0082000 [Rhododendron molle]KAI8570989.1 hypothetical protein RHMOL_Rhmol01G0082000 [Rhododendron molle]KAI8570991.1 hypothetical protein RHMOL_Rhmol01G0082000 [Rhododendron molle]
MANRIKEDEKNERAIRALLKLPDNRRCINCNSLGPQYVCTNFSTFVCTACSGIHREFTHRVKSVSMAKFTSQEVSALQGGGNASAKEIYFKEWDPQRHSVPDSRLLLVFGLFCYAFHANCGLIRTFDASNVERLRDFIRHVYVDRRYTGERSFDKPPNVKTGEGEDSYENRRETYQGGSRSPPYEDSYDRRYGDRPSPGGRSDDKNYRSESRSPPYEDTYERRYSDRPSPGGRSDDKNYRNSYDERRSPGYDQESRQYGDFRKSPARAGVVNDWRREERFGNGKRYDDGRISDGSSKIEGKSPEGQKDVDVASPPIVRPVREILGENVVPLKIIGPPKADGGKATDGSISVQRTGSSSTLASSNVNPAEIKNDIGTLIDFDAVPEPPAIVTVPQTQQSVTAQSVVQPTASSNAENWAFFDSPTEVKVTQAPSNANSLESVLSGLSVQTTGIPGSGVISTTAHVGSMSALPSFSNSFGAPVGQMSMLPPGSNPPPGTAGNNLTMFPPVSAPVGHTSASPFGVGAPGATPGPMSAIPSNGVNSLGQWPPQQHSLFPGSGIQPSAHPFSPLISGPSSNQPWNSSLPANTQGPYSMPPTQAFQSKSAQQVPGVINQSAPQEVKPSGRNELPQDLFAPTYPSYAPLPGWQTGPPHGFGFNMQYNTPMPMQTFPQSSQSTNPFDLNNEASSVQAPIFPSMASLQGALPNVAGSAGLLRASSLDTLSPTWMQSQSSYLPGMPPQAPMSPGAYMGQQIPNNLPPRHQTIVGYGGEVAAFGPTNPNQPIQLLSRMYSAPATPNSFNPVGGNPFG